jgi:hypothetical protein
MNKHHLQYFSNKAINDNLDSNLSVLINSREVLNNYATDRLSIDLLNSNYSFSP